MMQKLAIKTCLVSVHPCWQGT